jgi:hypothetical protein
MFEILKQNAVTVQRQAAQLYSQVVLAVAAARQQRKPEEGHLRLALCGRWSGEPEHT